MGKLGVALGPQEFLDTNMLVSAMQKSSVEGIAQSERFLVAVESRYKTLWATLLVKIDGILPV